MYVRAHAHARIVKCDQIVRAHIYTHMRISSARAHGGGVRICMLFTPSRKTRHTQLFTCAHMMSRRNCTHTFKDFQHVLYVCTCILQSSSCDYKLSFSPFHHLQPYTYVLLMHETFTLVHHPQFWGKSTTTKSYQLLWQK